MKFKIKRLKIDSILKNKPQPNLKSMDHNKQNTKRDKRETLRILEIIDYNKKSKKITNV